MPGSLLRLLVALAIALAVPIQGYAAVSAALCVALGQQHETHAAADELQGAAGTHCPPCSACYAAAAIAPAAARAAPEMRPLPALEKMPAFLAGVPPEKPDRPPLAL